MKQTWNKAKTNIFNIHTHTMCSKFASCVLDVFAFDLFASSCKWGIIRFSHFNQYHEKMMSCNVFSPQGSDNFRSGLMFYCRCLFFYLLVHPEAIACAAGLCFSADVSLFSFQSEISKMHQPMGAKFYTVISTKLNKFIMQGDTKYELMPLVPVLFLSVPLL